MGKNLGNSLRYKVPTGKMTAAEFCRQVGISRSTLQRLRKGGHVHPEPMQRGELIVWLYDVDNLKEVRDYQR